MTARRLLCRWFGWHVDALYAVGHSMGKECRYCGRPGILTTEEIAQFFGGGDEVVAVDPPQA
jgi:hypothetical protein